MDKKRFFIFGALLGVFLLLVYLQFRTWRDFDWATFWSQTDHLSLHHILHAVGLIYLAYVVRAIRWKIFLRPVRNTSAWGLIPPTIIGFAGLALVGGAGVLMWPLVFWGGVGFLCDVS